MPRSIYVAFEAFPRPKGASVHIASMLEAMAADFSPVLFLCLGHGEMPAWQQEDNILIARYKGYHPNMLKRAEGFAAFVDSAIAIYGANAKLCIFRDPWGGVPVLQSRLPWTTIFEVNALPSLELTYTYQPFSSKYALRAKITDLESFCLQKSDQLLTVANLSAEALSRLAHRTPVVIPNSPHPAFAAAFSEASTEPSQMRMGYFGSLHSWQGVETAINAMALLAPSYPEMVLEIVSGSRNNLRKAVRKRAYKKKLGEQVVFQDGRPVFQLASLVSKWWFSLAPMTDTPRNSVQGCCPMKIVESMACGVPVIASDLRVTREIISHQVDGMLVRPGCARSLASAMHHLFEDKKTRKRLADGGRAKVAEKFGREKIHCRLREFFLSSLYAKRR